MPKHRAPRVRTLRWSAFLGACALTLGSIFLLVTNSAATAHCFPAWSHCGHHPSPTPTSTTGTPTETSTEVPVDPGTPTNSTTPQSRATAPPYNPPAGRATSTSPDGNSQRTSNRPPGNLPKSNTPTTPDNQDAGVAPVAPAGGGMGGGGTTGGMGGGGVAAESIPTVEPATSVPDPTATPRQNSQLRNPVATPAAPTTIAIAPASVSSQCLLGTSDSGGCAGADTARDLAPAGLLILGALALLGSGSFLESLRGALRS